MSKFRSSFFVMAAVLGTFCKHAAGESPFTITTKRDDDKVVVNVEKDKAQLTIHSPRGISQAVIKRNDHHWPKVVTLRLHLKGLEHLTVSNGKTTIAVAVSSHDHKQPARLWLSDQEDSPLTANSPYWMVVRMVDEQGELVKTIPLVKGHFQMRLPKALFEENPKSITINWIDFYR